MTRETAGLAKAAESWAKDDAVAVTRAGGAEEAKGGGGEAGPAEAGSPPGTDSKLAVRPRPRYES